MNKIFAVVIILVGVTVNILPQESSFFDAPLGGGIGYTPGWIIPKVDGINLQLRNIDFPKITNGGFYTSGVSGFIYLGMLKSFRIGGFGFGGSRSITGEYPVAIVDPNAIELGQEQRETIYSLNGGGLSFEYTFPFVRDIAVSIGALLGRGSLSVELYRNRGNISWQNLWGNIYGSSAAILTLKNTYWLFSPTLNVEIPAYRMLCFRIGAGYHFTFGSKWIYDNNKDILNTPVDINGNSFFIQTGIFLGLFSF
jgi:hypothetical protein